MNHAGKKQYPTSAQRKALESIGIEHVRGRSLQQAQQLIDEAIRNGTLALDILVRPTENQIEFLRGLGSEIPDHLTKEQASALIDSLTQVRPLSKGQSDFIERLGGIAVPALTYRKAGDFIEFLIDHEAKCSRCGATDDRREERCSCGAYLPHSSPIYPPSQFCTPTTTHEGLPQPISLIERIRKLFGLS